jgi:hypothetical protein
MRGPISVAARDARHNTIRPRRCPGRERASKRHSRRNFGGYDLLEDSRYTSQQQNFAPHTRSTPLPHQTPACRGLVTLRSAGSGQAHSRLGRGWGWGSESVDTSRATTTTPTPALRHSRCFASAFLALRTAAEGRLCLPTRGVKTEFAARRDRTSRAAIATMLSAQFRWIRASRRFSLHESTRKFGNGPLLPVAPLNCCRHLTIYRGGRARRNTPLCKPLPAGPVCA